TERPSWAYARPSSAWTCSGGTSMESLRSTGDSSSTWTFMEAVGLKSAGPSLSMRLRPEGRGRGNLCGCEGCTAIRRALPAPLLGDDARPVLDPVPGRPRRRGSGDPTARGGAPRTGTSDGAWPLLRDLPLGLRPRPRAHRKPRYGLSRHSVGG